MAEEGSAGWSSGLEKRPSHAFVGVQWGPGGPGLIRTPCRPSLSEKPGELEPRGLRDCQERDADILPLQPPDLLCSADGEGAPSRPVALLQAACFPRASHVSRGLSFIPRNDPRGVSCCCPIL